MLKITVMTIQDYEEVMDFWQQVPELGVSPEFDTKERIGVYLEQNQGLSTIARWEGQVIGTVLCGHDGRRGSLYHVGVAPAYRGQGIAGQMIQRSIEALQQEGISSGFLFTHSTNREAARFWEANGWQIVPNINYHFKVF